MTNSLRYARVHATIAVLAALAAAWLTRGANWVPAGGLAYCALFFTWLAVREYANHRRVRAECEWARRRALGEHPAPLDPCCLLARYSHGEAHDRKCTSDHSLEQFLAQIEAEHRNSQ
ncbi:hypothetical protein AB0K66_04535 [Streptomyces werraensis]|uniref:hypothetical protein n=1 Tax=Streptomyces werraensis TaxID=68284 RepID=UPI0034476001